MVLVGGEAGDRKRPGLGEAFSVKNWGPPPPVCTSGNLTDEARELPARGQRQTLSAKGLKY